MQVPVVSRTHRSDLLHKVEIKVPRMVVVEEDHKPKAKEDR